MRGTSCRPGALLLLLVGAAACDAECNFETFLQVEVRESFTVGEAFVPERARLSGCQSREVPVSELRWASDDPAVVSIRADSLGFAAVGPGETLVHVRYVGPGRGNGAGFGFAVEVVEGGSE